MTTIDIGETFNVSTVDKESIWETILNYVNDINGEVLLLFDFVICYNPLNFKSFKKLLLDERIYMKFISSEAETSIDLANNLELSCIIDGYKDGRFEGQYNKIKKYKGVSNLTAITERLSNKLKDSATIENIEGQDIYVLDYQDLFGQLDNPNTLPAIFKAISDLHTDSEIKEFRVILGDYIFSPELLDSIAQRVVSFKNDLGIQISINIDDSSCINSYNSSLYKYNSTELTIYRKFEEFQRLKYNLAGMLVKYKHTRAVDTLGREGKGKQVSSRVSIYKGIATLEGYKKEINIIPKEKLDKYTVKENKLYNELGNSVNINSLYIIIQDLPLKYFQTKAYFSCSDSEEDSELVLEDNIPFSTQKIEIEHIGLYSKFIGRRFHFLKPWQENIEESERIIKDFSSDGFIQHQNVTIPEKMKIVFDDWEVEYNEEELNDSIEKNKEYLLEKFGKLYND